MKTRGITTLELTVSVAIGSIVFLILGGIFLTQARFFAIQDAIAETQIHAFRAADAVGLFTISARRVVPSQTINGTTYSSTGTTAVLELPSITSTGGLIGSTYDYVAIGRESATSTLFFYDLEAGSGSDRRNGKFTIAQFVDTVIFRYNTVDPSAASAIELYVRMAEDARGSLIQAPLGRIYYLGAF